MCLAGTHAFWVDLNNNDVVAVLLWLFNRNLNWIPWTVNDYLRRTHVVAVVNLTAVPTTEVRFTLTDASVWVTFRAS